MESIYSFKLKRALAKFRCGVLFNKYKKVGECATDDNVMRYKELCKWCLKEHKKEIGNDEYHIFYECTLYTNLREEYLPKYFHKHPNIIKFIELMKTQNITLLREIALFIYLCLNKYEVFLKNI